MNYGVNNLFIDIREMDQDWNVKRVPSEYEYNI